MFGVGQRCWSCDILTPSARPCLPVKIEAVSKGSIPRTLGVTAGVATRVAGQQVRRSRTFNAVMSGVRATTRSLSRALHQLWLEVTGTVFLAMAVVGALAVVREYRKYEVGQTTASRVVLIACFTLTFAWFGITSFLKVRRSSRQRS